MWQPCLCFFTICNAFIGQVLRFKAFLRNFWCFYVFFVLICLLITSVLVPIFIHFAYLGRPSALFPFFCFHLSNHFHFQIIVTQIVTPGMRPTQTLENTAACPSTSSNLGNIGNQTNIVPHQFYKLQMGKILAEYIYCYIGRKKNH